MDFETARIIIVDNVDYHTLTSNPSTDPARPAPCVLLIHALMSNLHMWDSTVRALHKAGYSTIRYDHIGHNKTPAPPLPPSHQPSDFYDSFEPADWPGYTIDTLTHHAHSISKDVLCALTPDAQEGPLKLHAVLGCSIGGIISLRFAHLYPNSTTHIISICAPDLVKAPETSTPLWRKRVALFHQDLEIGTEQLCQETVARWFPSPGSEGEGTAPDTRTENAKIKALGQVRGCTLQGYVVLAAAICGYDFRSGLGEGDREGGEGMKVLVVAGGLDRASDAGKLERQAGQVKGAEFVCLEEAGHLPPMHLAGDFEKVMLGFLGKVTTDEKV